MSFPNSTGILTPKEVEIVRSVFKEITSEDWFTDSPERKEQFAVTVIDVYREGIVDPAVLAEKCRAIAQRRFGSGGITC